jgi:four helix bundle protein
VGSVEDLKVFELAHQLTLQLYRTTESFPGEEKFGLTSQIRRACSSICANLMEGSHRNNRNEYRQFAGIARGSAGELKYHLMLAKDLGYLEEKEYSEIRNQIDTVSKMLYRLIGSLEANPPHSHSPFHTRSKGAS